jgi:integrase/recombinase XerD
MKSLFRWSHEEGHISKNPAAKIKEPKTGKRIPKFLTEFEIEHLREACSSPLEKALFEFMFSTGCRIGEIVSLEKSETTRIYAQLSGSLRQELYRKYF